MTIRTTALALAAALPLLAANAALAQRDGAPGNPPSTATQRALDGVTGNRTSPDGTGNNPPGTAAERALDRAGQAVEGRTEGRGNARGETRADPPGTAAERAYDRATGSNTSGAYPSNSGGVPQR
jgi:hypothetical protein